MNPERMGFTPSLENHVVTEEYTGEFVEDISEEEKKKRRGLFLKKLKT